MNPAPASETLLALPPPRHPEDRLRLAVLLDAVALLREHSAGTAKHGAEVATTVSWVTADDHTWPLSFVNVCRGLGLDASGLRAALRRELADLGAPALFAPPRPRVTAIRTPGIPAADVRIRRAARRER